MISLMICSSVLAFKQFSKNCPKACNDHPKNMFFRFCFFYGYKTNPAIKNKMAAIPAAIKL